MSRQLTHGPSHESLLRDVSTAATPVARSRLDAIVVPAARPASALQDVITLSATLSVPLVILCSRQAQVGQVVRRVERTFGARALVVDVPENYKLPYDAPLTSGPEFKMASAGRSSDLSAMFTLSVPPLVKIISEGSAPMRAATWLRALSIAWRAFFPAACAPDGLA